VRDRIHAVRQVCPLMPYVSLNRDGSILRFAYTAAHAEFGEDEYAFCRQFVIQSALSLAELDYDLDIRQRNSELGRDPFPGDHPGQDPGVPAAMTTGVNQPRRVRMLGDLYHGRVPAPPASTTARLRRHDQRDRGRGQRGGPPY
jgi:hypothetical protein